MLQLYFTVPDLNTYLLRKHLLNGILRIFNKQFAFKISCPLDTNSALPRMQLKLARWTLHCLSCFWTIQLCGQSGICCWCFTTGPYCLYL